jgi:tetratricopeptide (TPR) repeat protein
MTSASRAEFSNQSFHTTKDVSNWFSHSGIEGRIIGEDDLNGDGQQDWVIVIITQGFMGQHIQLWALIQQKDTVLPVYIWQGWFYNLPNNVARVSPSGETNPVYLYHDSINFLTFRIENFNQHWVPIVDYINDPFNSDHTGIIQTMLSDRTLKVTIRDDVGGFVGGTIIRTDIHHLEYSWDSTYFRFGDASDPDNIEQVLETGGKMLLDENNPDEAIQIFEPVLKKGLVQQLKTKGITVQTASYYTYLLGLAYEMKGDSANAARVYWDLWQTYPDSLYALAVQHKLEKIE